MAAEYRLLTTCASGRAADPGSPPTNSFPRARPRATFPLPVPLPGASYRGHWGNWSHWSGLQRPHPPSQSASARLQRRRTLKQTGFFLFFSAKLCLFVSVCQAHLNQVAGTSHLSAISAKPPPDQPAGQVLQSPVSSLLVARPVARLVRPKTLPI